MTKPMANGVRCMLMRGGTSKGAYFLTSDLPSEVTARDQLLLEIMGSPDARQIDGVGGAHPLTSKVAVVSVSPDAEADVDYLFLQVGVDEAMVTDKQNCGNLLAGVGPFAVERALVPVSADANVAAVRIRMLNTGGVATAQFPVAGGLPVYSGDCFIAGVPGTAAPIELAFADTAGSTCGALFPTGNVVDTIQGVQVTCIDNGMPVVILRAADVGVMGTETCESLEANAAVKAQVESIRLAAGPLMGLGDVTKLTVPKMTLVSAPTEGGTLSTRTFIPHRCHDAIGVLGAVSVATAAVIPGTPAADVSVFAGAASGGSGSVPSRVTVEHPTGTLDAAVVVEFVDGVAVAKRSAILRTARKLMDGVVFPRN